ncbi:PDZ domain-containing protein [Marinicella sp. S1101]|uniref:PDZ domain-containing protein n=1 Tax=Marinicella marina TaxID=2996016 RepID=UPI002260FD49|nr:PDZ domain-containing protein [Marinicella marina]MCX7553945.1 PDZ domain-containing protein [Marinicella marina]
MNLKNALLVSLFGISSLALADAADDQVNVNVNIDNGEGKITILRVVDGETQTIKDTFVADDKADIDALVDELLAEHGIEHEGEKHHKEVIKMVHEGNKDMVWLQKNDDVSVDLLDGQAKVIIRKDHNGEVEVIEESFDVTAGQDINVLIDDLMATHGIEAGDAEVHRKVIKLDRKFTQVDNNKPRLGFMANVKDNGWEVVSVVPGSGADEAGLLSGDVITAIDGQSTAKNGLGLTEFIANDHQEGAVSDVQVLRDGNELVLGITARVLDSPDVLMTLDGNKNWLSSSGKEFTFSSGDMDGLFSGLNVDIEHLDKLIEDLGNREIHVVTTADADAYFFSGSKMNQWLGKKHHFSTITENLGKYFGTNKGVLVLEVDADNKLGLKDGDVIQAINGEDVNSPKDVVRIMSSFKSGESFEVEIMRDKETIYLES